MYQINDVVFYANYGVCLIFDISSISFPGHEPKKYYHMRPLYDSCTSTVIKIPVDTKNIIRPVMSESEAKSFILNLPKVETVWSDNFKEREELFKKMIGSWKMEEWASVIKSIYVNKIALKQKNFTKPFPLTDQKYLEKAEQFFNQEISFALKLEENEVPKYIESIIESESLA